jgi:hypothetical protein
MPVTEAVVDALYSTRLSCLCYLRQLEQGKRSEAKRRAALIAVDLLEAVLLGPSKKSARPG